MGHDWSINICIIVVTFMSLFVSFALHIRIVHPEGP